MATRRTQPYRAKQPRPPGPPLDAMLNGRTVTGTNPADAFRAAQRQARGSLAARLRAARRR